MRILILAVRVLVGAAFVVFGLNYFLKFLTIPPPPTPPAGEFLGLLATSGYMNAIKVLEIVGGLLLVAGRFVPLGVVLLMPVAVNVALYEVFLVGGPGPGVVLVGLLGVVIAGYWPAFRGLVQARV